MSGRLLLAAALLGLAPGAAPAQGYDPGFAWRTLDTPHFQVHYHQGLEPLARRVAAEAERAHARLVPLLGHAPARRTQVVISDDVDTANGSATPIPWPTIRLLATPPESASQLNDYRGWLETLVTHEYVHVLHLDLADGFPELFNGFFGRLWVPNGLSPGWLIEGLAVAHEAPDAPGTGRNESALFDMYARALTVEPPGLPSLAQATNPFLEWPRGSVPYLLGGRFMGFVRQRSGDAAIRAFLRDQGSQVWPWAPSWAAERAFGADLPTMWEAFRGELEARYAAQLARVRERPVTAVERLTRRGGLVERPAWSPDGRSIAYLDRGLDERAGLRRVDPEGRDLGRSWPVDAGGAFTMLPDGRAVVSRSQVVGEFRVYDDLWLVDLDSGEGRRLTEGERATDPAATPDGAAVVYVVRSGAGEHELRRRRLAGGPAETLLAIPGAQLYEPAVSPDGRRIALSVQRDGHRDLALLEDGRLTRVTDDDAIDRAPAWTPDGRWLLFTSDRTGIYDLYAWEAASGRMAQVTNVESGALDPAVSPDGRSVAFVTYSREGFDVARLPLDPAAFLEAPPAAPAPPPPAPPPPLPLSPRPYRAGETLLPTFFLPVAGSDAVGSTWGIFTAGQDVVGRHTWQLEAWASPEAATAGWVATYRGGWSWPSLDLTTARFVDGSPGLPFRAMALTTPLAAGLTFSFTRLERALALRLGWQATRYDTLLGDAPGAVDPTYGFRDGLLSELQLSAAYADARRYARSVSPEEGRTLSLRLRVAGPDLGSDFALWRARAAWAEYLRVPGTRHVVLATRLSGALAGGSLGGRPPYSLGGTSSPDPVGLLLLQSASAADQLRGYPSGAFAGNGVALGNLELRLPLFAPELGRSTWPLFLRRVHGALFADAGETFVAGDQRGYSGAGFRWDRLRVGVGAELRLELALAYWIVTDLRIGVARGLGRPFRGEGPGEDPAAGWQVYVGFGPSF